MMGLERPGTADPALMLAFLRDKTSGRKLRLFACACCRLVWRFVSQESGRLQLEAVERGIDGRTTVPIRRKGPTPTPHEGASPAVYAEVACIFAGCTDPFAAALVASAMSERADPEAAGRSAQAAVLADLFGRPTRLLDRRWRSPEVLALAQSIYDHRRFQDLPRLAGLLEAAGCPPHNLLDHCRSDGPHVLGCWALDVLLGKS
ncbi:MAG TPA: hypothetical protein VMS17_33390 [Gemmataceae bacterium]|nr:hypothetical protein [Gemmataceae bacterium]